MTRRDHDCEEHRATNCDGEFHRGHCSRCGADLGTENCPDAGTWPSEPRSEEDEG